MLIFKDPRNTQVFSKHIGPEDKEPGKTAYMTQKQGEHRICVQCQGSKWFQTTALKWELSVDMGDTEFSGSPATRGELHGVERTVQATLARAEAISAENEYERTTESEFHVASERVNSHIVVVSLFFVAVEVALCTWQICHLRNFFKREKLI